jgi:hypothetical protein
MNDKYPFFSASNNNIIIYIEKKHLGMIKPPICFDFVMEGLAIVFIGACNC